MARADVSPARIPGYWMDAPGLESTPSGAPPAPSEKVLYTLHGGAYVRLSGSPNDIVANIPRGLLALGSSAHLTRAFSLEYRLSRAAPDPPRNTFPAALLDALAGYLYLVNVVGIAPADIVLLGDSAGGNLAHALARYLVENAGAVAGLPPAPGALVLLSPWVDLSGSHVPRVLAEGLWRADYLGRPGQTGMSYAVGAFLGAPTLASGSGSMLSRYISPGSVHPDAERASFVGFPRTMVVSGRSEVLILAIRTFVERMRVDLGARGEGWMEYEEVEDAVHDFLVFPYWEPERTETMEKIVRWLAAASGGAPVA